MGKDRVQAKKKKHTKRLNMYCYYNNCNYYNNNSVITIKKFVIIFLRRR